MRVYVAGGMRECALVGMWMNKLRAEGIEVTHDWTNKEATKGGFDSALSSEDALRFARADLRGVARAHVVWHIVANYEGSRGAYFEIGYAHALRKLLYVSGLTWRKSIFHHLADQAFGRHEDAFARLLVLEGKRAPKARRRGA